MKSFRYILVIMALAVCGISYAQTDRMYISAGNKLYRNGQFAQAEIMYRKAMEKNPRNPQAVFNLGNALLMQKKDSVAVNQYQNASKMETNKIRLAKSFHNIGVVCQSHQMYDEAIKAYEQALRNNPKDNETRYNLVLCKRQQKQNKNKNKNQNKNKNDKNKDKNKDKQNQNKNNKDKDKNKDQQKKNQQNKNQMSKDNAEQLLNAAIQQEQATQQRLKKAMQQPRTRKLDKNW